MKTIPLAVVLAQCLAGLLVAPHATAQTQAVVAATNAAVTSAEVDAFMNDLRPGTNQPMSGLEVMAKVLGNPKRVPLLLAAIEREPAQAWVGLLDGYCLYSDYADARNLPPSERLGVYLQASAWLTAAKASVSKALRADPGNLSLQVNLQTLDEALVLAYFESGVRSKEARSLSQALLDSNRTNNPNSAMVAYKMHSFLGRIALGEDDVATARHQLLEAGKELEPSSPQWFDPSFDLARDLLARGEREVVLEHLDQVARFWANPGQDSGQPSELLAKEHQQILDFWKEQIRKGKTPTGRNWPAALDAENRESYRISGRILDKSGAPVADARVAAYGCASAKGAAAEAGSDADGLFDLSIPRGSEGLLVHKAGYAYSWKSCAPSSSGPFMLRLTPPFTVSGVITDESGAPVADAEVWVKSAVIEYTGRSSTREYALLSGKPAHDSFSTRSDADGRFRLGQLPADAGLVLAARKDEKVTPGINDLPTLNQMPHFAGQQDIQLRLGASNAPAIRPGGRTESVRQSATILTITGVVRDRQGNALKGVTLLTCPALTAPTHDPRAQTDDEGRYTLMVGRDSLRSAGNNGLPPRLLARDAQHNLAAASELAESTTNLDFTLQPGLEIVGRVEEPGGRALRNAYLRLSLCSSDRMAEAFFSDYFRVDAEGRFQINGLPADFSYRVAAFAAEHGSEIGEVPEDRSGTNRVELSPFVLKAADRVLAGQLTDPEGKPVAGTFVFLTGAGQETASARTDAEGRFRFQRICEGEASVSVTYKTLVGFAKANAGETNVQVKLRSR